MAPGAKEQMRRRVPSCHKKSRRWCAGACASHLTYHQNSGMKDSKSLKPHATIPRCTNEKPVLVIVLDGWGEAEDSDFNAIARAETPFMDSLKSKPGRWRTVAAHGKHVGLNESDMGNSEVGHNALGGGKITDQGSVLVDKAIKSGDIFSHEGWKTLEDNAKKHTLHLIGLLSDGGVHSRLDQLLPLMQGAAERGVKQLRLHLLTDGRDCTDGSSVSLMQKVVEECHQLEKKGCDAKVASGGGRMRVTMDRYESDWNVVKRGYEAHILGEAPNTFTDPVDALKKLKEPKEKGGKPVSDQQLPPFVIVDEEGQAVGPVEDGDAVIVFNFRADRVVELSKALEYEKFDKFERKWFPKIKFAGMMQYDGELKLPKTFLVPPPHIEHPTGEFLVASGVSLYASAESQKIGHVTFFWNGNRSGKFDEKLETYHEVPSDQDISFNEKPAMKAREIADAGIQALRSGKYQLVRLNFANPDMVAHTGDLEAAIQACTTVDACVKDLVEAVEQLGGVWLITADHGNAEEMVQRDKEGKPLMEDGRPVPLTSHTLNPVPVAIGGPGLPGSIKFRDDLTDPGIANVGATVFNLLGFQAPEKKYKFEPTLLTG